MDFNNDKEPWGWHKEDHCLQKTSNFDISQELWNEIPQNEEDISYMFDDEMTPIKACGDLDYHVSNSDNTPKEPEECRETSLLKRRRMLQFHSKDMHLAISNEEMPSAYLKLNSPRLSLSFQFKGEDSIEGVFPEVKWVSGSSGNASASGYEDLEQSAEGWLAECFNDTEMQFSPEDMNFSGADNVQIDVAELCEIQPADERNVVEQHVNRKPGNVVFKGRKSLINMPTKLATSVAYPFAFIKPSGAQGDVTLKEINQRIQNPPPPPSKSKQSHEDQSFSCPKSAFSGKPVVGKTKIRTEGGKGSITIMRTKG